MTDQLQIIILAMKSHHADDPIHQIQPKLLYFCPCQIFSSYGVYVLEGLYIA